MNQADAIHVRDAASADAPVLARIYNHYVAHTVVTFEQEPIGADEQAQRIAETQSAGLPWLVAERGGKLLGYAYASQWKGRSAYRYSVEVTAYVADSLHGQGIGSRLYGVLLSQLAGQGMHVALAGIVLPNPASIALHERQGFTQVAHLREVGWKFGRWVDVGYWQRIFNSGAASESAASSPR